MKKTDYIAEQVSMMLPSIKRKIMSKVIQNVHISPAQIFVMLHLSEDGPCNFKHLCDELDVAPPTITGIVDRLEKASFVERCPDKTDRRSINIILTSKGKTMVGKIKFEMKTQIMKVLEKLSNEDQEKYLEIVRKIYEAIS